MIIGQMLEVTWAGMKVGFTAIFSALPIYQQLSDIQDQIWATFLGVSVIVVTIGGLLISGFKLASKILQ